MDRRVGIESTFGAGGSEFGTEGSSVGTIGGIEGVDTEVEGEPDEEGLVDALLDGVSVGELAFERFFPSCVLVDKVGGGRS